MSYFRIKQDLVNKIIYPSYFFYGQEIFLIEEVISDIKKIILPSEEKGFNFSKFELEENKWVDVISEAQTVPFLFSEKKLILVEVKGKRSESLTPSELSLLKEYFSSPSSHCVLTVKAGPCDRRKSLFKFFTSLPSNICCRIEFKPLKGKQLFAWIDDKVTSRGKIIGFTEKQRLIEITGSDLGNLNNEIDKLITYIGDKKTIQTEDIEDVTGYIRSFALWELTDSLEKFDLEKSLTVVNQLLNEGYHPLVILSFLSRFFQNLLSIKLMINENFSQEEIARNISTPYFKVQSLINLAKEFSEAGLNYFISYLKQLDLKCKSSSLNPKIMLENFLYLYWKRKFNRNFI